MGLPSPTTDWEETLPTPYKPLKLSLKLPQRLHTKPSQLLNTPMFTNQLPSEPSNQLQSSPRPSLPAQSLPKSQFLELKSPTSNQSTRPVPTPKPIKLHKPLLPQLLPLPQLPLVPTPLPQLLPSPQLASPLPQLLEPSDTVDTLLEPDTSPVPL